MLIFLKVMLVVLTAYTPSPSLTPGALNHGVTQANIHRTICVSGYTATIRPPSSYTTGLKRQQLASGYAVNHNMSTSAYEEDHLISLELGGSAADPKNLWPELYAGAQGARVKDRIENKLHSLICSGQISLHAAQKAIATDWVGAYRKYIGPIGSSTVVSSGGSHHTKGKLDPQFATCKAANAAGYGPYFKGTDPEFYWYRDANSDGKDC